jgi:hypothetical protein
MLPASTVASIELHFDWPSHGRRLTLGAIQVRGDESLELMADRLWLELLRVSRQLQLDSPRHFHGVTLEWHGPRGDPLRASIEPRVSSDDRELRGRLRALLEDFLPSTRRGTEI